MSVYIIRAEGTDFYKIGYTSGKPAKRLKALQTGCPHDLTLVAWFAGGEREEAHLHSVFAEHRVRGEWFRLSGAPLEHICAPRPTDHNDATREVIASVIHAVRVGCDPEMVLRACSISVYRAAEEREEMQPMAAG